MNIGPFTLRTNLVLAPMAGVTDRPFRQLCRDLGAGLAVSEMVSANALLRGNRKTRHRIDHDGESAPRSVQIAGADPRAMADAARLNVDLGAQIIDINMGCPAKKVCSVMAGSALLRDEALIGRIVEAVVGAVGAPVTLKIRTGWDPQSRNAVSVARIAESCGVTALAVHGRTRACGYGGEAEYDTIAAVKAAVSIPVIANGDITSPLKARRVLEQTAADALMIGRAAQGNPWIFREIDYFLRHGQMLSPPSPTEVQETLLAHLRRLHAFYGEYTGVRVARKHLCWYSKGRPGGAEYRRRVYRVDTVAQQLSVTRDYFAGLHQAQHGKRYEQGAMAA